LTNVPYTVTFKRIISLSKDALPEASRGAGRVRYPRADLHSASGQLGHHVSRHYDRGGGCSPGLGQAKAGNTRSDRIPGNLA